LSGKKGKKTRNLENPKKTLAKKDHTGLNQMKKMYLGAPNQLKKGISVSSRERKATQKNKSRAKELFCALVKFYLVLQNETTN